MHDEARRPQWASLQKATDDELVHYWLRGNDDAFAVIVKRYQRLVFSVAVRIVKDEEEAEDVVQTVFLDIFRQVGKFDPSRGTLKVWLLQYAYSRSLNRRHQLERRHFYSNMELDDLKSSDIPATALGRSAMSPVETAFILEEALAQLDHRQREAIELIYFEGLTFVEAVERTGGSLSQLRHSYYRGLMKIRQIIESATITNEPNPAPVKATLRVEVVNVKPRAV
jgi:RNA polymerase sigma-70 factor (ECF subfamily)